MVDLMFLAILYVLRVCSAFSSRKNIRQRRRSGTSPECRRRHTEDSSQDLTVHPNPSKANCALGSGLSIFTHPGVWICEEKSSLGIFKSIWSGDMCFTFYRVKSCNASHRIHCFFLLEFLCLITNLVLLLFAIKFLKIVWFKDIYTKNYFKFISF